MLMQSINQNPMHSIKLINVIKNFLQSKKELNHTINLNKLIKCKSILYQILIQVIVDMDVKKKKTNKKEEKTKKISRPKLSNAEFSAYSTN